jgi:hypothetical protein
VRRSSRTPQAGGQRGMSLLTVAGEPPGVDAVGLAQAAERADEGLELAGIGAVCGDTGIGGGQEQGSLVAAGGLARPPGRPWAKARSASAVLASSVVRSLDGSKTVIDVLPTSQPITRGGTLAFGSWRDILNLLGIVCGRPSGHDDWPLQLIKRKPERAGDPDDNERQAPLRDGRPTRAVSLGGHLSSRHPVPCRDNVILSKSQQTIARRRKPTKQPREALSPSPEVFLDRHAASLLAMTGKMACRRAMTEGREFPLARTRLRETEDALRLRLRCAHVSLMLHSIAP